MITTGQSFSEIGIVAIDPKITQVKVDELTNNKYEITGGNLKGSNLFHQFSDFNLYQNQIAKFTASDSVKNIINSISGGNVSTINGKIQCDSISNLYFINPAGFLWGKHASIDVKGSFYISTADYLKMTDKTIYDPFFQDVKFSTSSPESFGFLGQNGSIIFKETTIIPHDDEDITPTVESIYLISKDIRLSSTIIEPEKQISLSGVPQDNIENSNDNSILYSGNIFIENTKIYAKDNISICSGNIEIKDNSSLKINGNLDNSSLLETDDRNDTITIIGSDLVSFDNSTIESIWNDSAPKDLFISAQSVEFKNESTIKMSSSKRSGNVTIHATYNILFSNSDIFTQTFNEYSKESGNVNIDSQNVFFKQGSTIFTTTAGEGQGGNIVIDAPSSLIIDGIDNSQTSGFSSKTFNKGNAGNISIQTDYFQCSNGGRIIANTEGEGNAGTIEIYADHIYLNSGIPDENPGIGEYFSSGIYSKSDGAGHSGKIDIYAQRLEILNGALISNSVSKTGSGDKTTINASDLIASGKKILSDTMYHSGIFSESKGDGNSGEIDIKSAISITDSGRISVASYNEGNAGNIKLSGAFLSLENNAQISTEAKISSGGNISIETDQSVYLFNSTISSSVQKGDKDGGNIDIKTGIGLLNASQILANAHEGTGGNITINADHLIRSFNSSIDASSTLGIHGNVNILSPEITFNGDLNVLPSSYIDASQWLKNPCEHKGEHFSSFIINERDALPQSSDDLLVFPLYLLLSRESFIEEIKQHILKGFPQKVIGIIESSMATDSLSQNDIAANIFLANTYMTLGYKKKSQKLLSGIRTNVDSCNSTYLQSLYYSIYGDLLLSMGKSLDQSKKNLSKGANLALISKDPLLIAFSLTCLGNYFAVEGLSFQIFDFALNEYEKAITFLQDEHDIAKAVILINIASVSLKKKATIFSSAQIESSIVNVFQAVQKLDDNFYKGFYLLTHVRQL